jgi:hypothetical protein
MGHLLFRVNKGKTAVLDEEAVKLCPDLQNLNSKETMLLILYVDYFSPYAQLPDAERLRRAKRHVYGKDDVHTETLKKFKDAVEAYKGMQYDSRRETFRVYKEKIAKIAQDLLDEENNRKIPEHIAASKELENQCKELQAEIDRMNLDDEQMIEGGDTITYIERWQDNEREYKKSKTRNTKVSEVSNEV